MWSTSKEKGEGEIEIKTAGRIFTISGNNKGLPCPFKPIFCQEGYCKECQIYLDWRKAVSGEKHAGSSDF